MGSILCETDKKLDRVLKQMMMSKRKKTAVKYQTSVCVPRSITEAFELDKMNSSD